jgi:hypothetical protein
MLACLSPQVIYNYVCISKGQTHCEVGTQSHGSSNLMRRDWKTARPPKILLGGFSFKEVSVNIVPCRRMPK